MNRSNLTGIILAGGKSSRMGSNKALALFKDRLLIEYPIQLLNEFCSRILISTNVPLPFPFPQIKDKFTDCGPMGGIISCLEQSETTFNLVLACDLPLLTIDFIELILKKIEGENIIVPVHNDGQMESLCAIYPTSFLCSIKQELIAGNLALHTFILKNLHRKVPIPSDIDSGENSIFINFNTLTELEKYT